MSDTEIPVCSGLLRQRLIKANLRARVAVKEPVMTAINRKKVWIGVGKINVLTTNTGKIGFFSANSAFELYPNRREFVRRPGNASLRPKYTSKTVEVGSKKPMVWGFVK